ncbi:MAG: S53 family peptidase, partial [Candidatus Angelobacter sp.]
MTDENSSPRVPKSYQRIVGSERRPSPKAKLLGPADPNEKFTVTIVLRRRPDGPAIPDHDFFLTTPPQQRQRMSADEFASKYGALPVDIEKVVAFAKSQGLEIVETHPARRTVVVSGTVAQMSKAFAVSLGRYEHEVSASGKGRKARTETYRGRNGFVHVPQELADSVVGVFGLDNRRVTKRNSGDPPGTTTITVPQIRQLYNFPTNSAAGQTIAIFSEDGYQTADIQQYFTNLSLTMPTIQDITVDSSNTGNGDPETTQDICIAASAASGAAISVYFTTYSQQGWVDLINRVIHPNSGDTSCSVVSSSFYVANGDDAAALANDGVSVSWLNAVTAVFQDAAIQGVTICIASGDTGTDSKVGDGKQHVQYPASDPWVLSVGGTTVGNISGSSFDEYVWNDTTTVMGFNPTGATGGGVSEHFAKPSYQNSAGVPVSLNSGNVGRGVPDVAANASANSGYPIPLASAGSLGISNPFPGSGTSASAPLWAGFIAVLNAALGANVGFVNPALYAIGSSGFRDIVGAPGPADNGLNGVAGYPAGPGWDACTGWGSPNGLALLNGLRSIYNRTLYFIVDKSTYGYDEVSDVITVGGGLYSSAFWVVLEGFSISQLGSTVPTLGGAFKALLGGGIFMDASGPEYESPGDLYTPQRIRFPYNIIFPPSTVTPAPGIFPAAGAGQLPELLTASITVAGANLSAEAEFELVSGADPYFTNIDPAHNNVFYLSQDLRVFSTSAGSSPLPSAPAFTSDPYASIQSLLHFLNSSPTYTTPGADQLNGLPGQAGFETGDSSVTPLTPGGEKNFNFAIVRVRLQGATGDTAPRARVFFRLFVAQSCDTDFQPTTTYLSQQGMSGPDNGKPVFPQASGTGLVDPSGQSIQTIPYFATDANGTHDYDGTNLDANIKDIQIPPGQDKVWAYYGCFLDVYDASNQFKFPGTHHC